MSSGVDRAIPALERGCVRRCGSGEGGGRCARGGSGTLYFPGPRGRGRPRSTCPRFVPSSGSSPASSAAPTSTSCLTTTGRPSLPGSTASASVGFSWCPPCSTPSPGRRAISGASPREGRGPGQGAQGRGHAWLSQEGPRVVTLSHFCLCRQGLSPTGQTTSPT